MLYIHYVKIIKWNWNLMDILIPKIYHDMLTNIVNILRRNI